MILDKYNDACSLILYPLFLGLKGNTSEHFTSVVALKYYAIYKLSASVICRNSGKDVTIYKSTKIFVRVRLVKSRHVTAYVPAKTGE